MLPIEMQRRAKRNKKLRPIRIRPIFSTDLNVLGYKFRKVGTLSFPGILHLRLRMVSVLFCFLGFSADCLLGTFIRKRPET